MLSRSVTPSGPKYLRWLLFLCVLMPAVGASTYLCAQEQRPELVTQGGGSMQDYMQQQAPAFGPKARWVAALGANRSLLIFDTLSGRLARSIDTGVSVSGIAAHPSRDEVVVIGSAGLDETLATLVVYNVLTGKYLWKAQLGSGCSQVRYGAGGAEVVAPCAVGLVRGKSLATSSQVLRWNAADGAVLPSLPLATERFGMSAASEQGEISSSLHPSKGSAWKELTRGGMGGHRVKGDKTGAIAHGDGGLGHGPFAGMVSDLVDTSSGRLIGTVQGMVLAVSAKARTVVATDYSGLSLVEIATGKPIATLGSYFAQDRGGYMSATVSPDGTKYLLAGWARVTVIDAANGRVQQEIDEDLPYSMAWGISTDNNEIAVAQGNAVMVFDLAKGSRRILGDPATVMLLGSTMLKGMSSEGTTTPRLRERKAEEDQIAAAEAKAQGRDKKEMEKAREKLAQQDAADMPKAEQEARGQQEMMTEMERYMGTVGAVMAFPPAARFLDEGRLLAVRTADGGWGVWDTGTGNPLPFHKPLGNLSRYTNVGNDVETFLDEEDLREIEASLGVRPREAAPAADVQPSATAEVACSTEAGDHWVEITRKGRKVATAMLRGRDGRSVDLIAEGMSLSAWDERGIFEVSQRETMTPRAGSQRRYFGAQGDETILCSLSPAGDRLVLEVEKPEAKPGRKAKIDALQTHAGLWTGSMFGRLFSDSLVVYNTADGRRLCELENTAWPAPFDLSAGEIVFSADGKRIAAGGKRSEVGRNPEHRALHVWDGETCRQVHAVEDAASSTPLGFSADGGLLYTRMKPATLGSTEWGVHVWNATTGEPKFDLPDAGPSAELLALAPGGATLVGPDRNNTLSVWSVSNGTRLGTLRPLPQGEWLVTTSDGLFDGSPRGWKQIAWRDQDGLKTEPAEVFFSEFYRPGLFAELLDGHRPELPRSFAQVDRRQPVVELSASVAATAERMVKLRMDVSEAAPGGGVRDVRLFRNGVLVRVWRGDLPLHDSKAMLEAEEPVVAGVNHFSAYAFNHDNVKSQDAETTVRGIAPARQGRVFLLNVGVNQYANAEFNLRYAAPDATRMGEALQQSQKRLGSFGDVVRVDLEDREATKGNVMLALERLSGLAGGELPAPGPSSLKRLQAAQPEDTVMIYFAGHGIAWRDHFYLVPHDLGYEGPRSGLLGAIQSVLEHSISDVELEEALEPLDARHILLVIDACNSGKALDAEEQRRGPMNTRGLAQLAYEKGIDILTAAQSYQAALESSRLGHGYLTYVLAEEGLTMADTRPIDGKVTAAEWFEYASSRVPQLQLEAMGKAESAGRLLSFDSGDAEKPLSRSHLQTPRFYYRQDPPGEESVIARLR